MAEEGFFLGLGPWLNVDIDMDLWVFYPLPPPPPRPTYIYTHVILSSIDKIFFELVLIN